ncbi:MAG TPA: hypothetical protein VGR43_03320 [Dehalococcoidia bacterium]|nr:hypothetical protein [Dehalococcoidia bacterium]
MNAAWSIEDGRGYRSEDASVVQAKLIGLFPASAWTVEFQSGARRRATVFERLPETGVAAFDPTTTELARDPRYLPWDSAWFLAPQGVLLEGVREGRQERLREREPLPPPVGPWAGYNLAEYDLRDVTAIVATLNGATGVKTETVRVVGEAAFRPELRGEIVRGVTTLEGWPVYAAAPQLRFPSGADLSAWRVQITRNRVHLTETTSECVVDVLDALVRESPAATYQLTARGPIGRDLRVDFAIVAGLTTKGTRALRLPGDPPQSIQLAADGSVPLNGRTKPITVVLGSDEDVAIFHVGSPGDSLQLRVACNRVKWGLVTGAIATASLAVGRLAIYLDDLASGPGAEWGSAFLAATGIPGADVALTLVHRGKELCRTAGRTSRHDGRVALTLGVLRDAAIAEGASVYELRFAVSDRTATVATLHVRLKVASLACQYVTGHGSAALQVAAKGLQQFRNREVRVWSVGRVWEPVITVRIPDDARDQFDLPIAELALGRYRVELGVRDEWAAPVRPSHLSPNTAYFQVGSSLEYAQDLRRRSATVGDTHVACEALLAGVLDRDLSRGEVIELSPHLTTAAVEWLPESHGEAPILRALIPILRTYGQYLLPGMCEAAASTGAGKVTASDVLRLALLMMPLDGQEADAPWTDARRVWATFPYLAAQVDVRRAWAGDEEASSRCAEFLGCHPGRPPLNGPPPAMSTSPQQNLLALPLEHLRGLQSAMDLVPGALLTADEYVAAGFEWLALGRIEGRCERWWERHCSLQAYARGTTGEIRAYLAARSAPPGVSAWAALPELTLVAALGLLSDAANGHARAALLDAVTFAPRLIAFDLALARVLLARQAVAVAHA